ncbi:MAG: EAL domain-containing protein [Hyphomonadaceae bacterium]|nr:EAL domain-containing protein [Hyphomonadaceae bacterium]
MFNRLSLKLTALYAGLLVAALLLVGATSYALIASASLRIAHEQLTVANANFARLNNLRLAHLAEAAARSAGAPGVREALIDQSAAPTALGALRTRLRADRAFIVTAEGLLIGEDGAAQASVPPQLQLALGRHASPVGLLALDGTMHRVAVATLGEHAHLGWLVLADRLDPNTLAAGVSPEGAHVSIEIRARDGGWGAPEAPDRAAISAFIDTYLARGQAEPFEAQGARMIGAAMELATLDAQRAALLVRSPLSQALSPYTGVFNSLALIGLVGLIILVVGAWLFARGITQPLSTLEASARNLRQGVYEPVVVRTKDELSRLAASFNAMIDAIREREQRITHLAYHDAETRLPNRLALERRLATAQAGRVYLAAIGVDRFADVRGAIGYAHAGALMQRLGARLGRLAPNGPMARLSSDVLGIAFVAENEDAARRRAEALISHLEQPLALEGLEIDVNVSIGVAQPRGKDEGPAAMIERATIALDQARAARLKSAFFDEAAYGDPARNLSLMGEMRRALKNGDMRLVHQPKYNFRTGRIESVESLVRWRHPTRGFIAPDLFVPMAEETGHVRMLTEWVLERAVAEQKIMAQAGWPLGFSVNISGRLLDDAGFAEAALAIARGAAQTLCFEITETAVIDNPKQALENIERFAESGVRVAIDDYGSGLSSLAYLKQMPAHELKIDKMFVQNITSSERDGLLVRSTIELGHGLGMEVTAEGVETPAAFAMLASMRCDMAQGYLISRPSTAEDLIALLNDRQRMRFYEQTARVGAQISPTPESKSA